MWGKAGFCELHREKVRNFCSVGQDLGTVSDCSGVLAVGVNLWVAAILSVPWTCLTTFPCASQRWAQASIQRFTSLPPDATPGGALLPSHRDQGH